MAGIRSGREEEYEDPDLGIHKIGAAPVLKCIVAAAGYRGPAPRRVAKWDQKV